MIQPAWSEKWVLDPGRWFSVKHEASQKLVYKHLLKLRKLLWPGDPPVIRLAARGVLVPTRDGPPAGSLYLWS